VILVLASFGLAKAAAGCFLLQTSGGATMQKTRPGLTAGGPINITILPILKRTITGNGRRALAGVSTSILLRRIIRVLVVVTGRDSLVVALAWRSTVSRRLFLTRAAAAAITISKPVLIVGRCQAAGGTAVAITIILLFLILGEGQAAVGRAAEGVRHPGPDPAAAASETWTVIPEGNTEVRQLCGVPEGSAGWKCVAGREAG